MDRKVKKELHSGRNRRILELVCRKRWNVMTKKYEYLVIKSILEDNPSITQFCLSNGSW